MGFLTSYFIVSVAFHTNSNAGLPFPKHAKLYFSSEGTEMEAIWTWKGAEASVSEGGMMWLVEAQYPSSYEEERCCVSILSHQAATAECSSCYREILQQKTDMLNALSVGRAVKHMLH